MRSFDDAGLLGDDGLLPRVGLKTLLSWRPRTAATTPRRKRPDSSYSYESDQPPRRNTRTDSRDRNRGQFVPMPQLAKTRMLARLSGLNQAPADGFGGIQPVQTLNRRLRIPPFLVRTIVQFWWARAPRESVAARYASALGPAGLYLRVVSLRPSVLCGATVRVRDVVARRCRCSRDEGGLSSG